MELILTQNKVIQVRAHALLVQPLLLLYLDIMLDVIHIHAMLQELK